MFLTLRHCDCSWGQTFVIVNTAMALGCFKHQVQFDPKSFSGSVYVPMYPLCNLTADVTSGQISLIQMFLVFLVFKNSLCYHWIFTRELHLSLYNGVDIFASVKFKRQFWGMSHLKHDMRTWFKCLLVLTNKTSSVFTPDKVHKI